MSYHMLEGYFRSLVVGAETKIPLPGGKSVTAINFDNAATTPPFCAVLQEIVRFSPWYASVHRGKGYKSMLASEVYEHSREVVRNFVKAAKTAAIIFTKSTTEAINMLAYALNKPEEKPVVLSTCMEHLANDLPWRDKFVLEYAAVTPAGVLSVTDLEAKLKQYQGQVKLVTVTGASNVTGYINPVYAIARLAHAYGAQILVDGAQWVPHMPVDMQPCNSPEHIDYLVFSGHKMYAPFGAGVLIGPQATFAQAVPVYQGGGAVGLVSHQSIEWGNPPAKYEAGTPNLMGVLALVAAIKTVNRLNFAGICQHEQTLIEYALDRLSVIPGITLYGAGNRSQERVSLLSFTLEGLHHSQVAEILSQEAGIAVRNGLFCAHPYVAALLNISEAEVNYYQTHEDNTLPGLVRISFGLYNTCREIDRLVKLLAGIAAQRQYYARKYAYVLAPERCGAKRVREYPYC